MLQELLFLVDEVLGYLVRIVLLAHRERLLDELAFLFGSNMRLNIVFTHEVEKLSGKLHEHFARQHVWIRFEIIKWNELDDISRHVSSQGGRVKGFIIGVKGLHRCEICITHAYDDDSDRKIRTLHDLVDRLLHVSNDSIGQNKQDMELLIVLGHLLLFNHKVELLHDWAEIGWSIEL